MEWIEPEASAAHPIEGEKTILLQKSIEATAEQLGPDAESYISLVSGLHQNFERLLSDILTPPSLDKAFPKLARFGLRALLPATHLARWRFKSREAKALLAGCAAHSILPLSFWGTSAVGLVFLLAAHSINWPVAKGGSKSIAKSLVSLLESLGGTLELERKVISTSDLPDAKVTLFDLSPNQVASILKDDLPSSYITQLKRYRYGPSVFKIDYELMVLQPPPDRLLLLNATEY
ncbi:MAG: NAD(P)/FAD-dependent oxidoreductase [Symploca sp. SIO2E6]|nr:NAD(P)/FAD-dependent oxidoreductase [Symploca sp. SIO2E6]